MLSRKASFRPTMSRRSEFRELFPDLKAALVDGALHDFLGFLRSDLGAELLIERIIEQGPGLHRFDQVFTHFFFAHD